MKHFRKVVEYREDFDRVAGLNRKCHQKALRRGGPVGPDRRKVIEHPVHFLKHEWYL